MIEEVHQALIDLGYQSLTENALKDAIDKGPKSVEFTKLVAWVSKELQVLCLLDEHVNTISSPGDSSAFLMELSSFLKEMGCQYSVLMDGHVNERLHSELSKILLLDYLLTELKAARMIKTNRPDTSLQVKLNESSTANDMKNMLQVLKFPKPPANIPPKILFNKVEAKLKEVVSKVPVALYGEPLFTGKLSDQQWHALEEFHKELSTEYRSRKELLLTRLDVTIQSFEWSDRLKSKSSEIYDAFRQIRNTMTAVPNVRLSDILAARKDLGIIEKTSSASVRRKTRSDVNNVIIGAVPDRGGRPYEQEPPPPEMPSWQKRSSGPSDRGRGRGRGGNFNNSGGSTTCSGNFDQNKNRDGPSRGGRVQAGWNGPPSNQYQNVYESSGSYSKGSGGHQSQYQYHGNARGAGSQYQYQGNIRGSGSQYQYQGNVRDNYDDGYNSREYGSRSQGRQHHGQDTRNYQNYQSRRDRS